MRVFFLFAFSWFIVSATAQNPTILSGPFQGATTHSATKVWMLLEDVDSFNIEGSHPFSIAWDTKQIRKSKHIVQVEIDGVSADQNPFMLTQLYKKKETLRDTFYLQLAPTEISDFSFLAGSCTWPYRKGHRAWKIFDTMRKYPSEFMLWMGDNVYLLLYEWNSIRRTQRKYMKYRKHPKIKAFMQQQPNFAAWDDHDFGPNNSLGSFKNKPKTFQAFKDFWVNPSYGTAETKGTFYNYQWQDCEFFVLDGRYYKTQEEMYGKAQMNWLKQQMLASTARVKFIVGGSQFLNHTGAEDWGDAPKEKDDFIQFLNDENINGVVFLSGDRHVAEMMLEEEKGKLRLFEITTSPLTSFVTPSFGKPEKVKQWRLPDSVIREHNFAHISLLGEGAERKIRVEIRGRNDELWYEYEIRVDDLRRVE